MAELKLGPPKDENFKLGNCLLAGAFPKIQYLGYFS